MRVLEPGVVPAAVPRNIAEWTPYLEDELLERQESARHLFAHVLLRRAYLLHILPQLVDALKRRVRDNWIQVQGQVQEYCRNCMY